MAITITVSGPVACGKSAICGEIEIAMIAIGVQVTWVGGEREKRLTHADWEETLNFYEPEVVIVEVCT